MAEKKEWVKITNTGPGPRMVLLPTGGDTIQKGASKVLEMTETDYKGIQPYIDLGHLRVEAASEDEIPGRPVNQDIGGDVNPADPAKSGNPVDLAASGGEGDIIPASEPDDEDDQDESEDDSNDGPTHVEHRGFGRFYGMNGDEKITQAMTEAEANAYAEEHGLSNPVVPNPSEEDVTDPGDGGAADSTDNETSGEEGDNADESDKNDEA